MTVYRNIRIKGNGYSRRKAFVARTLGRMACSKCGVVLNSKEIEAMDRLRFFKPFCFECRGYSRNTVAFNIDGPLSRVD